MSTHEFLKENDLWGEIIYNKHCNIPLKKRIVIAEFMVTLTKILTVTFSLSPHFLLFLPEKKKIM